MFFLCKTSFFFSQNILKDFDLEVRVSTSHLTAVVSFPHGDSGLRIRNSVAELPTRRFKRQIRFESGFARALGMLRKYRHSSFRALIKHSSVTIGSFKSAQARSSLAVLFVHPAPFVRTCTKTRGPAIF